MGDIPLLAAVPGSLNYQSCLSDRDGSPISGEVLIEFSIYTVEIGGTAQWSDTLLLDVEQGLFSVELGRPVNLFPPDLSETPL